MTVLEGMYNLFRLKLPYHGNVSKMLSKIRDSLKWDAENALLNT